jgi:uncharacterized membrane protein YeaQ/YmgE (transglycosylase-associated protein family)
MPRGCKACELGSSRPLEQTAATAYSACAARRRAQEGFEMHYVWMAIVGFVVGLIARAVLPGDQKLGIIMTAVLGIVGALAAGFAGQALGWYQAGEPAGFIASVVGAVVVLFVYTKVASTSSSSGGSA